MGPPVQQPPSSALAPSGSAALAPSAYRPRLATPTARLLALLLEVVLAIVTLGIGWIVWSLVVWGRGTTPAKSLLRQRIVERRTGRTATWSRMAVRQLLVGGLLSIVLSAATFYVYYLVDALFVLAPERRRLTDRLAGTLVLQD